MGVLYLIKPGELTLKGKNRKFFEDRLQATIHRKLEGIPYKITNRSGRMYLEVEEPFSTEVDRCLRTTPGISGFAPTIGCEKEPTQLVQEALALGRRMVSQRRGKRFKVEARREDKTFPLTSYEIACTLGAALQKEFPELIVDLYHPDWVLYVEIRDRGYLYVDNERGLRGLPTGTSGRGLLLLSGGIDSPVAGFLMGVRGMVIEAVYFHSPPYTGEQALKKVESLSECLAQVTGYLTLHVVPFAEVQVAIRDRGVLDESTLMNRAAMMKIASKIARQRQAHCLITGESLGQVASQTIESIGFTNRFSDIPVLRPLIGMDKEWIMEKAREIGTYEISILPYEDCCSLFSPPHPLTRPNPSILQRHWEDLMLNDILERAIERVDRRTFRYRKV
ncbi:MAG: tRNA 4-thiouridine(8) synthase ThiI [Spirochaetes bacterium]|nr:tRNA 4-thiouridine(8) synthase ThiI [Spirochaetota bacterium]